MSWKNIINLFDLKFEKGKEDPTGKYAYDWAPAVSEIRGKKIGFNVSTIPPKQFSCPYHFHHKEEELFIVLEGNAVVRQAGKFREVKKGDLIFFGTGEEGVHQFYNPTDKDFIFFALSNLDETDTCVYPDSKKTLDYQTRKVMQNGQEVTYHKDEEHPEKFWPKEYL